MTLIKIIKLILYTVCLITIVNCTSFYHQPKGGFRPKKPKFSLSKQPFYYNSLIDTSAIYVNIDTLKYDEYKSVFYLKFYNNGRYFINTITPNNKLSITPGLIGYYSLNKNKIETEYFFVDFYNKWTNTKYIKEKGVIKNDTIYLESRFIKNKNHVYVKQKLNFIPKPSNW